MDRICIIAPQRSGTHALASVLEANGYRQMEEIFMRYPFGDEVQQSANYRGWLARQHLSASEYLNDQESVFERYFDHLDAIQPENYCVDIKYNSLRTMVTVFQEPSAPPPLLTLMGRRGFKLIHLWRRNLFLQALSEEIGNTTGKFHLYDKTEITPVSLSISVPKLLFRMEQLSQSNQIAADWLATFPNVELVYEDTFIDGRLTDFAAKKLEAASIKATALSPQTIKPHRDLRQTIANFDEVADALNANGYGDMLRNV